MHANARVVDEDRSCASVPLYFALCSTLCKYSAINGQISRKDGARPRISMTLNSQLGLADCSTRHNEWDMPMRTDQGHHTRGLEGGYLS